ncbi:YncE family protein [Lacunimicrobium album]
MKHYLLLTITLLLTTNLQAAPPKPPRIITRFLWQDASTLSVHTADLLATSPLTLSPITTVANFPKLDPEKQTLVQMEASSGFILVGVRDEDDGKYQSGWVLIDTGVDEEPHGDHSHWYYRRAPKAIAQVLNDKQGNPAHLYQYDGVFYMANDKNDGFTRFDPKDLKPTDSPASIISRAAFHKGGGGHITLAAVDNKTAFSTWIDRDGENKGRVDVVRLTPKGSTDIAASFHLPTGGIHGATACAGKVFFAPSEGICWTDGVFTSQPPKVNHIDLGKDDLNESRPRRTGAFNTFQNRYVAFTSGKGESTRLHTIDATQPSLPLNTIDLAFQPDDHASSVEIIKYRQSSPLAFIFHDHEEESEVATPCKLSVIKLDPNNDGNWQDAKLEKSLEVGPSKLEGHNGHHNITFDQARRYAAFTNPGDGTLTLLSIESMSILQTLPATKSPSKIIAVP